MGGEGAPRFSMSQTPFLSPSTVFIHLIEKSSVSSLNITNSSSQCFHCKHSTDIQETEPPKYEMMNILKNLCVVGHAGDVLASKRIMSVCLLADLLAGGSPGSQAGFSPSPPPPPPPPSSFLLNSHSSPLTLPPPPHTTYSHSSQPAG